MRRFLKFLKGRNNEKGFTLIELMVVIFVIGVIMAIATPNLKASGEKAQEKACDANKKLIQVQLENYYLDHHAYPTDEASSSFILKLAKEAYLDSVVTCPTGGTYTYENATDTDTGLTRVAVNCTVHDEE